MRTLLFVALVLGGCRTNVPTTPTLVLEDKYWCMPLETDNGTTVQPWAGCAVSKEACDWMRGQMKESGSLLQISTVGTCVEVDLVQVVGV